MKRVILTLIACLISTTAFCENYIKEGTEWLIQRTGFYPDATSYSYSTRVKIEGDTIVDGFDALNVYESADEWASQTLAAIIRVDENRVYVLDNLYSTNWSLLYDFDVKEGDEIVSCCVIGDWDNADFTPQSYKQKCVSIGENDQYPGFEVISLDEECYGVYSENPIWYGYWLKGLGSPKGLLESNPYGLAGGGASYVLEVTNNGEKIYPRDTKGGIGSVEESEEFHISANGTEITINNPNLRVDCALVSINGQVIDMFTCTNGSTTIQAPYSGIYVLRIGNKAYKVVI